MDVGEACRLAQTRKCECVACFYCDRPLDHHHQHDHFPIPKVAKGTEVVPTCLDCHDLKDRHLLEKWDMAACWEAVTGLLAGVDLHHAPTNPHDVAEWFTSEPSMHDEAILKRWKSLPPLSRILYAKMRSVHEEREHRARLRATPSTE